MKQTIIIEQGKSLRFERVASFRSKLFASEINDQVVKFVQMLKERGALKSGPMISATHGIEIVDGKQVLDIEFLVAIDRDQEFSSPYKYKEVFQLVNALYTRYEGNPLEIQGTYDEVLGYIERHNLQQITTVYNVNVNESEVRLGKSPIVDLYISINPNKL